MITGHKNARQALVIFADHTELKQLRLLKRGHRHCFAIIQGRAGWAIYNPLSHYTQIDTYPTLEADEIVRFYQGQGHTVIRTTVLQAPKKCVQVFPYTCVEAVKRVLGIQARSVVTPWQLRLYIENNLKLVK